MRTFTNKPGVVYDALKTSRVFAEDMNDIGDTLDDHESRIATQEAKPTAVNTPIGGVIAFLKTLTGVPALEANFVECNGQTLSDAASPLNGQVIPNLNGASSGTQRFLRGCTSSGGTGGTDTHNHTITDKCHQHTCAGYSCTCSCAFKAQACAGGTDVSVVGHAHCVNVNTNCVYTGLTAVNNCTTLPYYYQVVWVMRIK